MQIVTPRDGMLSNHEVLQHITNMKARYTQEALQVGTARAMKAENLETIMKEISDYLMTTACANQTDEHVNAFVNAASKFKLEKGEVLMMLNERPETAAELDVIIEEMESRFTEEEITEILGVVLSKLPPKPKVEEAAQ